MAVRNPAQIEAEAVARALAGQLTANSSNIVEPISNDSDAEFIQQNSGQERSGNPGAGHVRKHNRPKRAEGKASTPKSKQSQQSEGGEWITFGIGAGTPGFSSSLNIFGSGTSVQFEKNLFFEKIKIVYPPITMG